MECNMSHSYNEASQSQTMIAILESQLDVKNVRISYLESEIKRLTNLVESLINKDNDEPILEHKIGE
tara:strand:+ start:54 stop:254 length:201 start_codon:yes stop_codon:yes gene_type:complete